MESRSRWSQDKRVYCQSFIEYINSIIDDYYPKAFSDIDNSYTDIDDRVRVLERCGRLKEIQFLIAGGKLCQDIMEYITPKFYMKINGCNLLEK